MQTEANYRTRVDHIWESEEPPFKKARLLLALERQVKETALRLSRLGAMAQAKGNELRSRTYEAGSETLQELARQVRAHAKAALEGSHPPLSYGSAPTGLAVPSWEWDKAPRD